MFPNSATVIEPGHPRNMKIYVCIGGDKQALPDLQRQANEILNNKLKKDFKAILADLAETEREGKEWYEERRALIAKALLARKRAARFDATNWYPTKVESL